MLRKREKEVVLKEEQRGLRKKKEEKIKSVRRGLEKRHTSGDRGD